MLTIYLAALVFGGTLVLFSLLGSAFDADADDLEIDADAGLDTDVDVDGDVGDDLAEVSLGWLPLGSLRFWTFLLAFGGLTGALLTAFAALTSTVVAPIALAVGYVSGLGITRAVHHLSQGDVGRGIEPDDFVGHSGSVLLPVGHARLGQVRIEIGGRYVDRSAITEDAEPIEGGAPVLVYGVQDDGLLRVTRAPALTGDAE